MQNIPLFRVALALVIGILIAYNVSINNLLVTVLIATLFFTLIVLQFLYDYKWQSLFGLLLHALYVCLGILIFNLYNKQPIFYKGETFIVTILEKPILSKKSFKTFGRVDYVIQDQQKLNTSEKILIYFSKEKEPDLLNAGDVIIFSKSPKLVKNNGNPFEFDYANFLSKKRVYRNIYLNERDWFKTDIKRSSLTILAENSREKLLAIYRKQNLGNIQFDILSALTLGYKREIDPEIERTFVNSGAIHVLAVSGLHVSIVVVIITLMFGFLRKSKSGRILFLFISIGSLWLFAFITGLSPSVTRAATMFSFLSIGISLNRNVNIYNSLLVSAFLLLLFNPNNLFNIGFQLSYCAVFGIVFLQPKLSSIFIFKYKLNRYIWELITLSIAAQIATFPITTYYFNIFPTYFALTNIFIIPAITLLIPLGILLLVISNVPYLSFFIKIILANITGFVYKVLHFIGNLPFSTLLLSPTKYEFIFIVLFILSILLFIGRKRKLFLKLSLTFILILTILESYKIYSTHNQKIVIVYNTKNNPLHLIIGQKNYLISNGDFNTYPILNITKHLGLYEPILLSNKVNYSDENIIIKNNLILFDTLLISTTNNSYKFIYNKVNFNQMSGSLNASEKAIYLKLN